MCTRSSEALVDEMPMVPLYSAAVTDDFRGVAYPILVRPGRARGRVWRARAGLSGSPIAVLDYNQPNLGTQPA